MTDQHPSVALTPEVIEAHISRLYEVVKDFEAIGNLDADLQPNDVFSRGVTAQEDAKALRALLATVSRGPAPAAGEGTFQARVQPWMMATFGPEISTDKLERNDRFIEEALELVQASDYPKARAHELVEYVYGRDQGEINQEVGGVMVTLAAHCLAHGVDMHAAGETELARIWTKVDQIRAKQAAKPTGSALPIATPSPAHAPGTEGLGERLAPMIIEYVQGGISSNQDWRTGLAEIIQARVQRLSTGRPDRGEAPEEATGAAAIIRNGLIVISVAIDALPLIVSGSIADRNISGGYIVTDAEAFAKDVVAAINDENERGETEVHRMFDRAFDAAVNQGAEGVQECSEEEFEAEAYRLQHAAARALATLSAAQKGEG